MTQKDKGQPLQKRAYTVNEFERASTLSRSTTYRLLANGRLRSVKIGARKLILPESVDELLAPVSGRPVQRRAMSVLRKHLSIGRPQLPKLAVTAKQARALRRIAAGQFPTGQLGGSIPSGRVELDPR